MDSISYWLESVGPIVPRPRLEGDLTVDVAVVGGGFTGLWTAYELQRRDPSLQIAVLESEVAGFGASGRNGSWCVPELNVGIDLLSKRFGRERAIAVLRALSTTLDEIGQSFQEEGIDAGFDRSGVLLLARGSYQLPLLEEHLRSYQSLGMAGEYVWLDREAARDRLAVTGVEAALYTANGATLDPGRAVRGLAEAVERRGATLYEGTRVTRVRPGQPALIETERGRVRAPVVVLALEAYLSQLRGFRRRVLPIYSLITITEPLSEEQLASVRWTTRMCVASMRLTVDYLARTEDGRILVGGRGAPYQFGSRITSSNEHHAATHASLQRLFGEWFPQLRGVRFTHSWGGVLGMPRDWIPQFGLDREQGLAYAYGYTGHGVATANLAGRTLADLITDRHTELTDLALVGHRSPSWEPEPLRWLGVRYVQGALARLDARGERTGRPLRGGVVARRLAAH
ncbi:MAG TPA: FAD-binding oxidoreductase [Candidatus Dormibacteraeota bacterium]|nr:FAD-binding oxidoreductase [Candidatus Dormibacteraeota bacterium]